MEPELDYLVSSESEGELETSTPETANFLFLLFYGHFRAEPLKKMNRTHTFDILLMKTLWLVSANSCLVSADTEAHSQSFGVVFVAN